MNPGGVAKDHADEVARTLKGWRFPQSVERARVDDGEIVRLIEERWDSANSSTSKLLQLFRDELKISCEQGRFCKARQAGASRAVVMAREALSVRAVRSEQGGGTAVFAFFLHGADIMRIADIARLHREEGGLKGFQRREIKAHVNWISRVP